MGLDALLTEKDAVAFARSVGTTLFLIPEDRSIYIDNLKQFVTLVNISYSCI
jgi:hypothetical protein